MSNRVTVPEGHVALVLPNMLANELESMCRMLRKHRKYSTQDKNAFQSIAGDILLAMLDQREDALPLAIVTRSPRDNS